MYLEQERWYEGEGDTGGNLETADHSIDGDKAEQRHMTRHLDGLTEIQIALW